jgi:hypothetical protein
MCRNTIRQAHDELRGTILQRSYLYVVDRLRLEPGPGLTFQSLLHDPYRLVSGDLSA